MDSVTVEFCGRRRKRGPDGESEGGNGGEGTADSTPTRQDSVSVHRREEGTGPDQRLEDDRQGLGAAARSLAVSGQPSQQLTHPTQTR